MQPTLDILPKGPIRFLEITECKIDRIDNRVNIEEETPIINLNMCLSYAYIKPHLVQKQILAHSRVLNVTISHHVIVAYQLSDYKSQGHADIACGNSTKFTKIVI